MWNFIYSVQGFSHEFNKRLALLVAKARLAGGHKTKTKTEVITAGLVKYVKSKDQQRILEAFGTIDLDPACDYKAQRSRIHT